jgi:hypothetical protein
VNELCRDDPDLHRSKDFADMVDDIWSIVREEALRAQVGRTP